MVMQPVSSTATNCTVLVHNQNCDLVIQLLPCSQVNNALVSSQYE